MQLAISKAVLLSGKYSNLYHQLQSLRGFLNMQVDLVTGVHPIGEQASQVTLWESCEWIQDTLIACEQLTIDRVERDLGNPPFWQRKFLALRNKFFPPRHSVQVQVEESDQ